MGQAKQRGTYEERKAEGIAKHQERERLAVIARQEKERRLEEAYEARRQQMIAQGDKPPRSRHETRLMLTQALAIGMIPLIATSRED